MIFRCQFLNDAKFYNLDLCIEFVRSQSTYRSYSIETSGFHHECCAHGGTLEKAANWLLYSLVI